MKIIFYLSKVGFYRIYSPIIEEALIRKYNIEIWHSTTYQEESKSIELVPYFKIYKDKIIFRVINSDKDIASNVENFRGVDFFISLFPNNFFNNKKIQAMFRGKIINLMTGLDTLFTILHWNKIYKNNNLYKNNYDIYLFIWTNFFFKKQLEILKKYSSKDEKKNIENIDTLYKKIIPTGYCEIDKKIKNLDEYQIRKDLNIKNNKKALVYLPYPFSFSRANKSWPAAYAGLSINFIDTKKLNSLFDRCIAKLKLFFMFLYMLKSLQAFYYFLNGFNEKNTIRAIRKFCDNNNLILIIKKRKKHRLSSEGYKLADLVIDDKENNFYPTNFQKILKISKLAIGYNSTAVFESIAMNVPFINLECPSGHFYHKEIEKSYSAKKGYFLNYKNVVWNFKIPLFLEKFNTLKLYHFALNENSRKEYIKKFLNEDNENNTTTFFDTIEDLNRQN